MSSPSPNFYLSSSPPPEPSERNANERDNGINSEEEWETEHEAEEEHPVTPPSRHPILPSSGPVRSSPIRGSPTTVRQIRRRKSQKKRQETLQNAQRQIKEQEGATRRAALDDVIIYLHSKDLKLWDLLEYIFNPVYQQGTIRHNDFFIIKGRSKQILEWWLSPHNRSGTAKAEVREWVEEYAVRKASHEARVVTASKKLQTMGSNLDGGTVKDFDLTTINEGFRNHSSGAPFTLRILESFSTSRHVKTHTESRKKKTNMVC